MRHRCWLLACVVVALLATVFAGPAAATPEPFATPDCATPTVLPPQPDVEGAAQEEILRWAGKLAVRGRLDAAQRLYDLALTSDPADPRAGLGLAYVQARRMAGENCVAEAAQVRGTDPAAADAMLQQALSLDAGNTIARETLVTPATDDRTGAEKSADRWDAFVVNWVDPLVRLIVPVLIALAVLLVLARALTSAIVRRDVRAWHDIPRRWAARAGFALLVVAAVQSVGLAAAGRTPWAGTDWSPLAIALLILGALPLLLLPAAVIVWFSLLPPQAENGPTWALRSSTFARRAFVAAAAVAGLLLSALALWAAPGVAAWLSAVSVAGLGLVLVAAAGGHALRLLVQVKKGKDEDAPGTAYVLARLQELGTSPPEGLKAPQQVDVQSLPIEALKSLPGGRVAAAMTSLLNVVLPATPWRAVVEGDEGASRVVVTVTRNGSVVRTALVDPGRFLRVPTGADAAPSMSGADGEKASDSKKADPGDLLTAAAAVVLTELSLVHRKLAKGLCGATRWESVAAHVVATKPPATAGGPDLRRGLLAYAVQADPRNALAQLAYATLQGKDASTAPALADYATGLTQLLDRIERQAGLAQEGGGPVEADSAKETHDAIKTPSQPTGAPTADVDVTAVIKAVQQAEKEKEKAGDAALQAGAGYLPLRLRARHSLTATWLNVAVQVNGPTRTSALALAASNYCRLVALLETAHVVGQPSQDLFLDEMNRVACALKRAFGAFVDISSGGTDLPNPPRGCAVTALESPYVLYDDACISAATNESEQALAALARAAGLEDNRTDARIDPWFEPIRSLPDPADEARAKTVKRFWEIVGPPPLSFTELPVFGEKGSGLAAVGVTSAAQLLEATEGDDERKDMAKVLAVPLGVVMAWRRLAELARPSELPGEWLTPRQLQVLHASGIRSLEDLGSYVTSPADSSPLDAPLSGKAQELGVAPLDKSELDAVASRGGAAVSAGGVSEPPGGGVPPADPSS